MRNIRFKEIEVLLDLTDEDVNRMYRLWDIGDCSKVGLGKVLLFQLIKQEKEEFGDYYNREIDQLLSHIIY